MKRTNSVIQSVFRTGRAAAATAAIVLLVPAYSTLQAQEPLRVVATAGKKYRLGQFASDINGSGYPTGRGMSGWSARGCGGCSPLVPG